MEQNKAAEEIRCPNCGSQRHRIYRYPRYIPPTIKAPVAKILVGIQMLFSVFVLEGKKLECRDCGHRWFPRMRKGG